MQTTVTTYHLEMTDPADLRPSCRSADDLAIVRVGVALPAFNRFLYTAVGGDWHWIGRLSWTYDRWMAWLDRPELETWVAYHAGAPAGYCELEAQADHNVEIAYFGLLPEFTGRGFGGILLTRSVQRAWEIGARRVWVHTCSLDHTYALANYQARGFRLFHQEEETLDLGETPGPWPNARV